MGQKKCTFFFLNNEGILTLKALKLLLVGPLWGHFYICIFHFLTKVTVGITFFKINPSESV